MSRPQVRPRPGGGPEPTAAERSAPAASPSDRRIDAGGSPPRGALRAPPGAATPDHTAGTHTAVLGTGQARGRRPGRTSGKTPQVRGEGAGVLLAPAWGAPGPGPRSPTFARLGFHVRPLPARGREACPGGGPAARKAPAAPRAAPGVATQPPPWLLGGRGQPGSPSSGSSGRPAPRSRAAAGWAGLAMIDTLEGRA